MRRGIREYSKGPQKDTAVKVQIWIQIVTYDLARQMEDAQEVKCSEFGAAIRENIEKAGVNH